MGSFNSFLQPGQNDHHTSGFVQNQSQITGSVSRETFTDRKRINQQRTAVGAYTFAGLHQLHRDSPLNSRPDTPSAYSQRGGSAASHRAASSYGSSISRPIAPSSRITPSFREPTSRSHNPYA